MTVKPEVGDLVEALFEGTSLSGEVLSVFKRYLKVRTRFQSHPRGPWYSRTISLHDSYIRIVIRKGEILQDLRPLPEQERKPIRNLGSRDV